MESATYTEVQHGPTWIYAILGVSMLVAFGIAILIALQAQGAMVPVIVLALVMGFALNVITMRTRVEQGGVRVSFGAVIPIYWRTLRIAEMEHIEAITYRPIRESGGWGIRWGRREGRNAHYLTMRGHEAVQFEYEGQLLVLGSSAPDALIEAILAEKAAA